MIQHEEDAPDIDVSAAAKRTHARLRALHGAALDFLHRDRLSLAQILIHILQARSFRRHDCNPHSPTIAGAASAARTERSYQCESQRKNRSTASATRPRMMPPAKIFELIMGTSVSEMSAETPIAAAIEMPNSPNNRPTLPGMNEIGRN